MEEVMIKLDPKETKEFTSILSHRGETKWKQSFFLELAGFLCFIDVLIAGFTSNNQKHPNLIWDLEAWKWCLIIFVTFGGAIFTKWLLDITAYLMEIGASKVTNQNVKHVGEKVSHVFNVLKRSVHVFLWLDLVLVTWLLLTTNPPNKHTREIIDEITKALKACIVGIIIWMVKTLFLVRLALSFIVKRSEKKIRESLKEQEDLRTLCDIIQSENKKEDGGGVKVLTEEYHFIKKVRHWTPEWMINEITKTELPILVRAKKEETITVERAARITADDLFGNIAIACGAATNSEGSSKSQIKYIKAYESSDEKEGQKLLKLLKEVITPVEPLDERIKFRRFRRSDFRKWVVRVFLDRLVLLRTINGRDEVLGDLNRIVSLLVLVLIFIVWLVVMGFLTTQVMLIILTQLLALNFMFTNTAKTMFEAIIFVFSTRPFDVGDHCKIETVEMVVHDMNILNTIFKLVDGEKVYYPNSILMEKNIVNLNGMPDSSDSVEFDIDINTPNEKMKDLEEKIKEYLVRERKNWNPDKYNIEIKEDEQIKTFAVILHVNHTINFYNGGDRGKHRENLVSAVRNIIEDLKIRLYPYNDLI